VVTQLPYNFADRDAERAVIPMAKAMNVTVAAWGLLSGGAFTGKYNEENDDPKRYEGASDKEKEVAQKLVAFAREIGRSPSQVAINWVRQQENVIPILGARTVAQIEDNLGILDFTLTNEQLQELSQINPFQIGFPLRFLTNDHVRGLIFGETFAYIDHPQSIVS
jgi:aryl-alcohol dehydrogenase-like predicted oxidoreductase